MNSCLECTASTKNAKFCNRSCSAKYNNRKSPKRKPEGTCAGCATGVTSGYKYCSSCTPPKRLLPAAEDLVREKRNTKKVGDRCEMEVLYRLSRAGLTVCAPVLGEDHRFDLVAEEGGRFFSIQCKSGRLDKGAVVFNTSSSHYHRGGASQHYQGQVDLFGVYCPDTDEVYFISPMAVPTSLGSLRVDPVRNGQIKGIRWAKDFQWAPGMTLASLEAKR